MKNAGLLLLVFLCAGLSFGAGGRLETTFAAPPDSAKPWTYWFWLHGNVSRDGITADLEAMKRVGINGVMAFQISRYNFGDVKYMSDEWRRMMKHTIEEADRLGMEVCIHSCSGWANSGGPWITPEYAMQRVVWTEQQVEGPGEFSGMLERPSAERADRWHRLVDYYRDIAVLAVPTPQGELDGTEGFRIGSWFEKAGYRRKPPLKPDTRAVDEADVIDRDQVVVLTSGMDADGNLSWRIPEGKWTLIRFGYAPTGVINAPSPVETEGLECDKLSKAAAELHWKHTVQNVIDDAGPLVGRSFTKVLIDSYEMGCQNWTPGFGREFEKRTGYSIVPYLPVLTGRVVGSLEVSERFLWDFRRVVADLFAENYYGHFAEMCHRNGLQFATEPYGTGNIDELSVALKADLPMAEFWVRSYSAGHDSTAKLAASAAHANGKKFVGAEAYTAKPPYSEFVMHPALLKSQGDFFYCRGINRFIFHTYAHQPWKHVKPGMTMGHYGLQMNRNNTWFEKSVGWLDYLARCQFLLQEGSFCADLCYLTDEDSPSRTPLRPDLFPAPPDGYDYDFCNAEILMQMTVKDGRLQLPSGMSYRMLVLPAGDMRPAVLAKISELVNAGASVYGDRPEKSPSLVGYPACDAEIKKLADELWTDGRIIFGVPFAEALLTEGILPDFEYSGVVHDDASLFADKSMEIIHRKIDGADVYFVSNQRPTSEQITATFRVNGMQPELWRADTGTIEDTPLYSFTDDGRTSVPLFMEPAGSVFVVFRNPAAKKRIEAVSFLSADEKENAADRLEIKRAVYGALDGAPDLQVDVTEMLREMVQDNRLIVTADTSLAGDPARGHRKKLKVDYQIDGEAFSQTVKNGATLSLSVPKRACFEADYENGDVVLSAMQTGRYDISKPDGKKETLTVDCIPESTELDGPWTVCFPAGWGAPEQVEFPELMDWTEHDNYDICHFSGTAVYSKTFNVPAERISSDERIFLDLGTVCVIAQVRLDGNDLGILWKPPYKVEITDVVQPGENRLEIEVVNLWVNRMIGDEKYPQDCAMKEVRARGRDYGWTLAQLPDWVPEGGPRPVPERKTFATWKFYTADDDLQPSGLIGPVCITYAEKIRLK